MLHDAILQFYQNLHLPERHLPEGVKVMNPYRNPQPEVQQALRDFYGRFYCDTAPRGLILGINPGRFGAGVTGIPFTDTRALREDCTIDFAPNTRETSAEFVYKMIEACGGTEAFYKRWFIGAACPLGFVYQNLRGNWVNYNYYDKAELYQAVKPFMIAQLKAQKAMCGHPKSAVVWGTGKNFQYLSKLNEEAALFEELLPLEHPRYIMQYKRRHLPHYLKKFQTTLGF